MDGVDTETDVFAFSVSKVLHPDKATAIVRNVSSFFIVLVLICFSEINVIVPHLKFCIGI
jgi:hypothetical protein